MRARPPDLPDFDKPPVIEIIFGVQFSNLEHHICGPHVGAFWETIRDEYPRVEDRPPLPRTYDTVPGGTRTVASKLPPLRRSFLYGVPENWLLQVQANRLLYNWRAVTDEDEYPHFEPCFQRFASAWDAFGTFCADHELPAPEPDQLELTYVNHIPQGPSWNRLAAVGDVFPDISWRDREGRSLGDPQGMTWEATFQPNELNGRLRAKLVHGTRNSGPDKGGEVLVLELTVRGDPPKPGTVDDWFFRARCEIVRAFVDLTDEAVQRELWERRS